tara:strand:- start:1962 stop:2840 length:879 start_codon:yes stop_codon:yes gene_type:complete
MPNNQIPQIYINGSGLRFIRPIDTGLINIANIPRPWMTTPPQAVPYTPPVTVNIGVPVVDMPGCVKVHKENAKRDPSKNKNLVNDDPKGNVVLCDGGMPYYEPPDYQANELTWTTVYGEPEEVTGGVDTGDPPPPPESNTERPNTPEDYKDPECPGPTQLRVGDVTVSGDERVTGHQLITDPNNPKQKICETLYEPTTAIEKFLPSTNQVSTTASIAVVATAAAAATPLLLRVVKPIVQKTIKAIQKKFGKKEKKLSISEIRTNKYRREKGLPELRFGDRKNMIKDLKKSSK